MSAARFVILHHLAPTGEHWDLMLECDENLATWQLAADPTRSESNSIPATRINNHRKRYLEYEGPIGGGRGVVARTDGGACRILTANTDQWAVEIVGQKLQGRFRLLRIAGSDWMFDRLN